MCARAVNFRPDRLLGAEALPNSPSLTGKNFAVASLVLDADVRSQGNPLHVLRFTFFSFLQPKSLSYALTDFYQVAEIKVQITTPLIRFILIVI